VVTGLGVESVYETGLTLHHTYGFPFLPGQTIKGVVRGFVIVEEFDGDEKQALADPGFCAIFGSDDKSYDKTFRRGSVVFFDGLPSRSPKPELDIMNPHFSHYYEKDWSPGEYDDPVPVHFLSVKDFTVRFRFGLLPRAGEAAEQGRFAGKNYLDLVSGWLKAALSENGIGAKTAVGYGRMT